MERSPLSPDAMPPALALGEESSSDYIMPPAIALFRGVRPSTPVKQQYAERMLGDHPLRQSMESVTPENYKERKKNAVQKRIDNLMLRAGVVMKSDNEYSDNADPVTNFISATVTQFLGVRSLLRLGATCKSHRAVIRKEIDRRRNCIAKIAVEVRRLMVFQKQSDELTDYIKRNAGDAAAFRRVGYAGLAIDADDGVRDEEQVIVSNPTRENVIAAKSLAFTGVRLIDDELFTIHCGCKLWEMKSVFMKYSDAECWDRRNCGVPNMPNYGRMSRNHIFRKEMDTIIFSLNLLPDCFYFSDDGEFTRSMYRGAIREACTYVTMTFTASLARNVDHNIMNSITGRRLAQHGLIDTFCVAVREYVFVMPELRDCFWSTITKANAYERLHPEDDISFDEEDVLSLESVMGPVDRDHFREVMMADNSLDSDEVDGLYYMMRNEEDVYLDSEDDM